MKNATPLEDGAEALTEFDIKMRLGAPHKIDRNNQIAICIIP